MKHNTTTAIIAATFALTTQVFSQSQSHSDKAAEWHQQQQIEIQRGQIQRLQKQQRDSESSSPLYTPYRPLGTAASPAAPQPFTPTAAGQARLNSYLQKIMADPTLSHAAKVRLVEKVLGAVK